MRDAWTLVWRISVASLWVAALSTGASAQNVAAIVLREELSTESAACRAIDLPARTADCEDQEEAGAKAYILKDIAADALVACIRDVLAGKTYLAPTAAAKLAERVTQVQLTPRELSALRLMANGQSNKEIATSLDISERTVKTHLAHLFDKLGVTSRTEAVRVATRRGLVRFD